MVVRAPPSVTPSVTSPTSHSNHTVGTRVSRYVQRHYDRGSKNCAAAGDLERRIASLRSGGSPLAPETREFFEARFGRDFSGTRIHTDARSAEVARSLNARAFAVGNHIGFAAGEFVPGTESGRRLIAHELTHVVQQGAATSVARHDTAKRSVSNESSTSRPMPVQQHTDSALVQRQTEEDEEPDFLDRTLSFLGGSIESAIEWAAPNALQFFREGIGPRLTRLLCDGVDTFVARILSGFELRDVVGGIAGSFRSAREGVGVFLGDIRSSASEMLGSILEPVVVAIQEYGLPFIGRLQGFIQGVQEKVNQIWQTVGRPVADFLTAAGSEVWNTITSLADWVWDVTEPIRDLGTRAWNWVKAQFNLAWESSAGAREWIVEKASAFWETVTRTLQPIMGPLRVIGGVFLLFSPLGPFIVLNEVILPLWERLRWLWNNWNATDVLVRAREILHEDIIPSVIRISAVAAGAMANAATWLSGLTASLSGSFEGLQTALGVNGCVRSFQRVMNFIARQFHALADWARNDFTGLVNALSEAFRAVVAFLEPILDFLGQLILTVANPLRIPVLFARALWGLVPERLKPPIATFVIEVLYTFLLGFPAFLGLGPLGTLLKRSALGFLNRFRGQDQETVQLRVQVANRIAELVGGSARLLAGYSWGLLRGIWSGLVEPFEIIALLIRVVSGLNRLLHSTFQRVFGETPLAAVGRSIAPPSLAPSSPPAISSSTVDSGGSQPAPSTRSTDDLQIAGMQRDEVEASLLNAALDAQEGSEEVGGNLDAAAPARAEQTPAPPSPETMQSIGAAAASMEGAEAEWRSGQEQASSRDVANETGLFNILWQAWDRLVTGAAGLGRRMANAFLEFIGLPDFQVGNRVGFVAGMVLFEIVLALLTAGGSAALNALKWPLRMLVRLLDLGGEIFGVLTRVVGPLLRPMMGFLASMASYVSRLPGMRAIVRRVESALRPILRYADEAASAGRRGTDDVAERVRASRRVGDEPSVRSRRADELTPDETSVVNRTTRREGRDLTGAELDAELAIVRRRLEARPGLDEVTLGGHTWRQSAPGRWCRHSTAPFCVVFHPETGRIRGDASQLTDFERRTAFTEGRVPTPGVQRITIRRTPGGIYGVSLEGVVRPPPGGRLANFNSRRSFLFSPREVGLPNPHQWQQLHLWGPGFGDEAAAGLWLGPRSVNLRWQNDRIESMIRQASQLTNSRNGTLQLLARAEAQEFASPVGLVPFLRTAEYDLVQRIPGERTRSLLIHIEVAPPPSPRIVTFDASGSLLEL